MAPTLPKFQRSRGVTTLNLGALARLEENVAAYAAALTDERRGLLAHGLTLRDNVKGCVLSLEGVTVPSDWVALSLTDSWTASGSFVAPAYRVTADGRVMLRGAVTRASAPGSGSQIAAGLPLASGDHSYGPDTNTGIGWCVLNAQYGLLFWFSGGYSRFNLGEIEYDAADRRPPSWPTASQKTVLLPDAFPGEVGQVLVIDAVDESSGLHTAGARAAWSTTTVSGKPALVFSRFDGLSVGRTYTLTLAVLTA